jgi:hypothetical protein
MGPEEEEEEGGSLSMVRKYFQLGLYLPGVLERESG